MSANIIELDCQNTSVKANGTEIELTDQEFSVLKFLMENVNELIDYTTLIMKVDGWDTRIDISTLRVTVERLRDKVGKKIGYRKFIRNRYGKGYYLDYDKVRITEMQK